MCELMSAAAAVMAVAGAALQSKAQADAREKSERAMQAAQEAENARQARYQQTALQTFDGELAKMDRAQQDQLIGDKAAQRQALYDTVAPATRDYNTQAAEVGASSSAPKVIQDANASTLADALSRTRTQLAAKAKLGGFADRTFTNAEMLQRGAGDIGIQGGFAKGSAGVFPLEMQAASRAGGSGNSLFGQLLSLGGTALGAYNAASGLAGALGGTSTGSVVGMGSTTPGVGSVGVIAPSGGNVLHTSYSPYLSQPPHVGSLY